MGLDGIVAALALAVSAPAGMPPPSRLATFVVVRTRDHVHTGRRIEFDNGQFLIKQGDRRAKVAEADIVHIVFVPALDGTALSTAMGLAFRAAVPDRPKRMSPRRDDLLTILIRSGGIFFLHDDDLAKVFGRFVRAVEEPDLTGVLCHELVRLCQKRGQEETAVRLLAEAEKHHHGSDRGFVCALMRVALLRAMGDTRVKDEMRKLFESYQAHTPELRRFRAVVLGELSPGRRRKRPDGSPDPPRDRPRGRPGLPPP